MKLYVDELPSCCEDCVCHNGVSGRCKLLHRTTFDIPPRDCPIQSLSDYTKQVRKEVYDYILDRLGNIEIENNTDYNSFIAILDEVLDQI